MEKIMRGLIGSMAWHDEQGWQSHHLSLNQLGENPKPLSLKKPRSVYLKEDDELEGQDEEACEWRLGGRRDPFMKCNIRVLGGLVSGHLLATDSTDRLGEGVYKYQLLTLAEDLGKHFLPAFDTPTGLPYAWVNLKDIQLPINAKFRGLYGVMENETTETSTSGNSGSLILEMGALSQLTGDPKYESAAFRALHKLWSMRSSLNLLGTNTGCIKWGMD
ncbi:hypothetical protein ACE6H2_016046 [Prunus campanulata]